MFVTPMFDRRDTRVTARVSAKGRDYGFARQCQKLVEEHEDLANEGVDKVAGLVEAKTPEQYDARVGDAAAKAKEYLDRND